MRTFPSPDQDETRMLFVVDEDAHTDADVGCRGIWGRRDDRLCLSEAGMR